MSTPKSSLKSFQRQFPTSQPSGEEQDRNPGSNHKRRPFVCPFDANISGQGQKQTETDRSVGGSSFQPGRGTQNQNQNQSLVREGSSGRTGTQRPPGVPPEVCWVSRQPRCHSRFHEGGSLPLNRQPSPLPRPRTPDVCWTCGQQGCRSWYHAPRVPTPPPLMSQSGNVSGTRNSGNRVPTQ